MRRGSPAPPLRACRSSSPTSIVLEVPDAYKVRRLQEPSHLSITDSWMFKGVKAHVGDLHLCDIVSIDEKVVSRSRIEVMCEYTWIDTTPSQERLGKTFPAVYVPGTLSVCERCPLFGGMRHLELRRLTLEMAGNTRSWRGIERGRNLHDIHKPKKQTPTIRDEHAQRQPLFPYEPTFQALQKAQSHSEQTPTSFRTVELVSDADTLSQLFLFLTSASPRTTAPFRLELSTVRNTLFLGAAAHPRRGHTAKGGRLPSAMPDWAVDAVGRLGSHDARLPFSGGHYRVVRYRMGKMVCAVRGRVHFVYEHRRPLEGERGDPLLGVQPETIQGDVETWKTAVKPLGRGTTSSAIAVATVRYAAEPAQEKLASTMPTLWFGRVPFVVDAVISPKLEVREAHLLSARDRWAA